MLVSLITVNIQLLLLVGEVCLMIFLTGFGIRFVLYDEDGPNLNRIYRRYFGGRLKKRDAEFTRTVGLVILLLCVAYGVFLVLNDFAPLSSQFFGSSGG